MSVHFTIIIPAYNVEKWAEKNLKSALMQNYENYSIFYVDDASTDNTSRIVNETLDKYSDTKAKFTMFSNKENRKALANIIKCVKLARDKSVILTLDGDDWLPNPDVLATLNEIYSNEDVWMTTGSYLETTTGEIGPPRVGPEFWEGNIRHKIWVFSHLRTFRKELFMKIDKADMTDHDGEIYKCTFDQVMMYPMAEMAGPKHYRSINQVLYIYNRANPLSVDRVQRPDQLRIEKEIRNKTPYEKMESLR